jgi:hypothetical protein
MTQAENPTINALLTAKVAAMSPAQADARVLELYDAPNTPENMTEFVKLMFGADTSIGE